MAKSIYQLSVRQQFVAVKNKIMWVLRPKRYTTTGGNDIKKIMAQNSTIPKEWIQPVLDAQAKTFQEMLLNGHNITLPGVGTFSLHLKTIAHDNKDDVDIKKDILWKKILFKPCKELQEGMKEIEFQIGEWSDKDGNIYFPQQ